MLQCFIRLFQLVSLVLRKVDLKKFKEYLKLNKSEGQK